MARKRAENREGSLGFPGFVKPVFTKDSKTPREKEKITRAPREREPRTHLKKGKRVDRISFNPWRWNSRVKVYLDLLQLSLNFLVHLQIFVTEQT
ncbi:hypothetical protein TNCV_4686661 [Trichonephila clavipes]|nr:hypothetical protein TNCV_4686661 [Trichonephila clavipes]